VHPQAVGLGGGQSPYVRESVVVYQGPGKVSV
jgi:hypothetical protein